MPHNSGQKHMIISHTDDATTLVDHAVDTKWHQNSSWKQKFWVQSYQGQPTLTLTLAKQNSK